MKSKTATKVVIGIIFAATVLLTFIQPSVIHQLVVWVGGSFAVLVALALFVVGNWPVATVAVPKDQSDRAVIDVVRMMRKAGASDEGISRAYGFDIDVIKAIPR